MKLSDMKYFSIEELSRSAKAELLKLDNTPDEKSLSNLIELVDNILDPLREAWGNPIIVNSGYRSKAVNVAVGGSKTSQHVTGLAADITVGNPKDNEKLFNLVKELELPFDQLIDEYNFSWVHISYSPRHRRQVLKIS